MGWTKDTDRVNQSCISNHARPGCTGVGRRQDLGAAKAAIEELFGKIGEIRRKAEASEVMVQEICRDIRKLDFAKQHLTHTITALRRLAMLVNAVGARPSLGVPAAIKLGVKLCPTIKRQTGRQPRARTGFLLC